MPRPSVGVHRGGGPWAFVLAMRRAFEKHLFDEEVHFMMTLQWHRIVPHLAKVRGWTITPSHFLNQRPDTVWLRE
jgi:peptide/nickel transport system substrate-binding protein